MPRLLMILFMLTVRFGLFGVDSRRFLETALGRKTSQSDRAVETPIGHCHRTAEGRGSVCTARAVATWRCERQRRESPTRLPCELGAHMENHGEETSPVPLQGSSVAAVVDTSGLM